MQLDFGTGGASQSFSAIAVGLMAVFANPQDSFPTAHTIVSNVSSIISGELSSLGEINTSIQQLGDDEFEFETELSAVFDGFLAMQKPLDGDIARIVAQNLSVIYAV